MNKRVTVSADGQTVTVHVPMTFRKRGGRKLILPDGGTWAPRPRVDNAMVKALARAFRWRKMLDTGVHAALDELARAKGPAPSYVSGILRLTLLAQDTVEASATITHVVEATCWQPHTVRGALAGALKKRLGLVVLSEKIEGRGRVYRLQA